MKSPSVKTLKRLYAVSGNLCAFPNCRAQLIDPTSETFIGETCHVRSRRPLGPRYDHNQTDEERNSFENLLAMCPSHHKVIDDDPSSYSVQRLEDMKRGHEAKVAKGFLTQSDHAKFLELLDNRINLILERSKESNGGPEAFEQTGPGETLRKLAGEQRYKTNRSNWRSSDTALTDVVNAINKVINHFEDYYQVHSEELRELNILKNSKARGFRSLYDGKFISQIKLVGIDGATGANTRISEIFWNLEVYKTRPTNQPGLAPDRCYTDIQLSYRFAPDINEKQEVIWREVEGNFGLISSEMLAEKVFELFINQIQARLDEGVPGGRYIVGGELVNAWGEMIEDDDNA